MKIPPASVASSSPSLRGKIRRRRALAGSIAVALAGVALYLPAAAPAASITWGAATDISAPTDVSTTGTSLGAVEFQLNNVGTQTVNGVTFTALNTSSSSFVSGPFSITGIDGSGDNNFSAATPYDKFLAQAAGGAGISTPTVTISGLTVGDVYSFQVWDQSAASITATAGNSVTLNSGGAGQFSLGTFEANATTETITFGKTGQTNGFQLRLVGLPATYWLGQTDGTWTGNNWASDPTGTPTLATPTAADDVTFSATGAANQGNTTLGQNFTIHSLTDNDTTPVVISSGVGGPFTLTIAGNAGTGITVATGANLTINSNVTLGGSSDTIEVDGTGVATLNGTLNPTNGLNKTGTGMLTLAGTNTYSTTTTVSAGTLNITGTSSGGGAFAINGNGSTLTINSSGMVAASGVTFAAAGSETLNLNGGIFLVGAGGISTPAVSGTGLVFNGGTLQSSAAFNISNDLPISILAGGATIDTTGGNITSHSGIGFTASPGNLTVQGGNTLTVAFESGMTGEITVTGNTTLAMASASTTSGLLNIVSGSTLDLNDSSASFGGLTGAGSVINSTGTGVSTLTITGTGGNNFSGTISAATPADTAVTINLTSGIQTFSGANTYGGGTIINGGTLLVTNGSGSATGSGGVDIKSGGTLGGNGTISGAVTLESGGTIAPGAGVAGSTLHGTSVTWNGGGALALQLGNVSDQLALTGALTKGTAGAYTVTITDAGGIGSQSAYTLATFGSTTFLASNFTLALPAGYSGALLETSTALDLALAFAASGPVIQNVGGPNTPLIADFTVTGPVNTGGPLASNTINSLILTSGSSLTILNTLNLTSGKLTATGGTSSIMGGTLIGTPQDLTQNLYVALFGRPTVDIHSTLIGNTTLLGDGTGTLLLDGLLYGNMSVLQGLLGGNGSIFGNLFNAGTVSPGHSPGTLNVSGNYTQASNGLLKIEIGGTALFQHDLLSVGGRANLNGTLQLVQLGNFTLQRNQAVTFLTATGGIAGRFSTIENGFISDNILQPTVVYGSNSVSLEGLQGSFAALPGLTPNQLAVGRALDSAANDRRANALFNYLDYRTLNKLPGDLDRIAPEELTSVFTIGVSLATVQSQNIQRRTDDIRSGSNGFNAANLALNGDSPSYSGGFGLTTGVAGPSGDDGKEVKETKQVMPAENRWGTFLSGTGEWVSVGNTDNARGYNLESGGFTLGVDYKVTPNLALGLAAGYTGTTADLTDHGRVWVNGGKIGLYGTFFQNAPAAQAPMMSKDSSKDSSKEAPAPAPSLAKGFYADVAVFGGYNSYDTRRSALQGETWGNTDGGELNVLFGTGYDFKAGGLTFGPTASFNYTYLGTNGFTEHDSLAPLDIHGGKADSLRSAFGVKASYDWKCGGILIKPEIRAAWQHEYGDAAYDLTSSFANGAGDPFTVAGPQLGRDSLLLGAGFAIQCSERISTYFYYDGELFRTNYQSTNVTGGVRIAF